MNRPPMQDEAVDSELPPIDARLSRLLVDAASHPRVKGHALTDMDAADLAQRLVDVQSQYQVRQSLARLKRYKDLELLARTAVKRTMAARSSIEALLQDRYIAELLVTNGGDERRGSELEKAQDNLNKFVELLSWFKDTAAVAHSAIVADSKGFESERPFVIDGMSPDNWFFTAALPELYTSVFDTPFAALKGDGEKGPGGRFSHAVCQALGIRNQEPATIQMRRKRARGGIVKSTTT